MKESKGKEAFKKPFLFLGLAFVALGCTLGFSSLAWFATPATSATVTGMEGEATGSYFESGVGTESDPYIIANAKQLYYFAWLQDMGFFNAATTTVTLEDGSTKPKIPTTYFKIKDGLTTIDASAYVLPPVGIEKYPFVGNFDANNCTITGLTISNKIGTGYIEEGKYPTLLDTDNTRLTKDEFNSTSQASIVGFFGIIGQYNSIPSADYESKTNEVKNLYLDEITIKTADKTANTNNLLIGIFAGYVNGIIDNCGVHYAKMNINGATSKLSTFSNVSRFTLIGDYNTEKYSYAQDQDSGSSSGGDAGYGTSTDIRKLHGTLTKFSLVDSSGDAYLKAGYAIPFKADTSATPTTASGTMTLGGRTVTKASTVATSSTETNIGFYVGGTVDSVYDSTGTMRIFKDHYASTSIKVDYDNIAASETSSDESTVPERVKTYVNKIVDGTIKQGDSVIKLTTPNLLYETMNKDSGYYAIENTKVGSYEGDVLVPNNAIWVAPQKAGTFEFVCVNENTGNAMIAIWKLKRSTPLDYSTSLSTPSYNQRDNFKNYPNADFVGMAVSAYSSWSSDTYTATYYGTPVTEDNIENGVEFAITLYGNPIVKNPIYITYMDIGSDGGDSSSGDDDKKTIITNFDFVTKDSSGSLTKIKSYNETSKTYEANSSYVLSEVTFKIGDMTGDTTTLAFRRLNDTVGVYYYQSPTVLTPSTSGTKTASTKEDCTSA